jgi:hypothetical protein
MRDERTMSGNPELGQSLHPLTCDSCRRVQARIPGIDGGRQGAPALPVLHAKRTYAVEIPRALVGETKEAVGNPHMISFDDYCGSDAATHLHSRRHIIIAAASAPLLAVEPLAAAAAAADSAPDDESCMRLALDEARQGDYAFAAVIVRDGQILARGHNLGKTNGDPTAHGEMVAIRDVYSNTVARPFEAAPSTLPVSRARCVWVLSFGAALAGLYLPHRCSSWRPR